MAFNCVVEAMGNLSLILGMTKKVHTSQLLPDQGNKICGDTLQFLRDQGNKICGSSGDWILLTNPSVSDISLFNLWKKAIVNIPPIPYLKTNDENHVIHKALLSSLVSGGKCYRNVMAIYGEKRELASYSLATKRWKLLPEAGACYDDVICHKEVFYAVDKYGKVVHYRFDDDSEQLVNQWCRFEDKVYLVVVGGDLFLIVRYVRGSMTNLLKVYKLEGYICRSNKKKIGHSFSAVSNMKEWAIVLSHNQAVALPAKSQGLRENCIYFKDVDCSLSNDSKMRVFGMEQKSVEVVEGGDADKLNRLWQELYFS